MHKIGYRILLGLRVFLYTEFQSISIVLFHLSLLITALRKTETSAMLKLPLSVKRAVCGCVLMEESGVI